MSDSVSIIARVVTKDGRTYQVGSLLPPPPGSPDKETLQIKAICPVIRDDEEDGEGEETYWIFCEGQDGDPLAQKGCGVITKIPKECVIREDNIVSLREMNLELQALMSPDDDAQAADASQEVSQLS